MGVVSISELMKMDRGLVKEVPTKEVYAKHLSKILGKRVTVKVKALSGNTSCSLVGVSKDKKGDLDMTKLYKAQSLIVVEGMVEPSLKDKELQEHFGAVSPTDLAAMFFPGGEMVDVYDESATLSGYGGEDDVDEEVKNL